MKKILMGAAILFASGVLVLILGSPSPGKDPAHRHAVTVYKTPTCGCCTNYVSYLREEKYDVTVIDQESLMDLHREKGITPDFESCHTTVLEDGTFVEGHIPVEAIHKLITEKPPVKGIALPGMPSASPGMPGAKTEPFDIKQVLQDGTVRDYMKI